MEVISPPDTTETVSTASTLVNRKSGKQQHKHEGSENSPALKDRPTPTVGYEVLEREYFRAHVLSESFFPSDLKAVSALRSSLLKPIFTPYLHSLHVRHPFIMKSFDLVITVINIFNTF